MFTPDGIAQMSDSPGVLRQRVARSQRSAFITARIAESSTENPHLPIIDLRFPALFESEQLQQCAVSKMGKANSHPPTCFLNQTVFGVPASAGLTGFERKQLKLELRTPFG